MLLEERIDLIRSPKVVVDLSGLGPANCRKLDYMYVSLTRNIIGI